MIENNLRTLGPAESKVVLSFREQGRTVVRASDVLELLGSENSARKVIRNLIRKGWLSRIVGGRYMLLPPEHGPENLGENNILALAAAAVEPSYIGWWSAASYHGFTTQKPMTVFVAVQRQVPVRTIEGSDVRFIKVTPRKFFGYGPYKVYDRIVLISTPEKTFVDCLDHPELCGGPSELARIAHSALAKLDLEKLRDTVLSMKSKAVFQRLGFLSDLVGRPLADEFRSTLRTAVPKSYRSTFGRTERREGI
ncbi:type IV toxin-antitoxin system AbiEi family antitoxin domain-containing protein [Bradyrhizobium symbiodeficiens]|uniref:type IV toxin-antitoxin system AbiEi family antitoxin domain-containing protein n=1 Tax=Bradyrhizobium symbiodeficiens TaxID=1404367 RepID=UPI001930F463|nr:type IV toxin-antitoxin system AbiEi family antitoxin [Bradyrhizobium symbiodeficiens]